MECVFRTNLDLHQSDKLALSRINLRGIVPTVGTVIELNNELSNLHLEVVAVTLRPVKKGTIPRALDEYYASVELHLPRSTWGGRSLRDFFNWYAPKFGQTASAYI